MKGKNMQLRSMTQALPHWIGCLGAAPVMLAGGCVNVTAPDKPIVINLNISITQEVVYRLDNKAKAIIQDNPGIF
nr:YnbE family lipoprotein [Sphingomonas sp. IBVSS2]